MPMKQARLPKWTMVIRDLKRGAVKVVYKDMAGEIESYVTLSNSMIPDQHMAESNPNNPTKLDDIRAWDTERLKWVEFKISTLEKYEPFPGYGWGEGEESGKEVVTRETSRSGKKGSRNRTTETGKATQETKADDRGTEGQGERESGEGTGRTWSSKEQ